MFAPTLTELFLWGLGTVATGCMGASLYGHPNRRDDWTWLATAAAGLFLIVALLTQLEPAHAALSLVRRMDPSNGRSA